VYRQALCVLTVYAHVYFTRVSRNKFRYVTCFGCLQKGLWNCRRKPALKCRIWLNLIASLHSKEHPTYGNMVLLEILVPIVCSVCQLRFRDFHIAGQVFHSNGTYSWNRWVWTLLILKYEHSYSSSQVLYSVRDVFLNGFCLGSVQVWNYVTVILALLVGKNHGVEPPFATRMAFIFLVYCIHKTGIKLDPSKNVWLQCIWGSWKRYIN
jgi:hypothetical protein